MARVNWEDELAQYASDWEKTQIPAKVWGDAGSYSLALKTALSICAGQVAALNQWRQQMLK